MSSEASPSEAPVNDSDTAVTVQRAVSHPLSQVWDALLTTEGAEALLGSGGRLGDKGHSWQASDGTRGVTRSFHPQEQIRFSWHADDDAPATMVDLRLHAVDDSTTEVQIVHNHLPDDADKQWLEQHWTQSLERIDSLSQ